MRLSVLSSGSSGNAVYVESSSGGLLVDAGVSCRRLKLLLTRIGLKLEDIGAVLITHGHGDHTSGIQGILRERSLPIFAAPGVAATVKAPDIRSCDSLETCGFTAKYFEVPHDTPTFGLRLSEGDKSAVVATDLGEVTSEALRMMRGADVLVLEANHDLDWLMGGSYSADLKRRVSSGYGHLSNYQAAEAALALAPDGLKDLVLAHLSRKNNSPARATGTVTRVLREGGHGGVRVRAALAGHPTPMIEVGEPLVSGESVYRYDVSDDRGARLFNVE